MVSVAYTDFHNVMNLSTTGNNAITAVNTENLLDYAIDLLNIYSNSGISNMSGAAGSKTVTLTSAQRGAVFMVGRALYYSSYRNQVTVATPAGVGLAPVAILENPTFERLLYKAASMLVDYSIVRT
jgi:hypothetical protein